MALLTAVERLIEALSLDATGEVLASSLRSIAETIDEGDSSAAVSAQLHHELFRQLSALTDAAPSEAKPRIGLLRGEQARLVAIGLGYPRPDEVDIDSFCGIEALRLKRARRLARLPVQPALQDAIDAAMPVRGKIFAEVQPDEQISGGPGEVGEASGDHCASPEKNLPDRPKRGESEGSWPA